RQPESSSASTSRASASASNWTGNCMNGNCSFIASSGGGGGGRDLNSPLPAAPVPAGRVPEPPCVARRPRARKPRRAQRRWRGHSGRKPHARPARAWRRCPGSTGGRGEFPAQPVVDQLLLVAQRVVVERAGPALQVADVG